MMTKVSEAQRKQRQEAPLKHGGAAAVISVQKGTPLHGLAAQAEQEVTLELENKGALALIQRNATRLQAACDLYWNAVQVAAQDGDLKALDHYVARYGWLAGCSLRAWTLVRQERRLKDEDKAPDIDAVLARYR
jgi:hypothetical protein